MRKECPCFQCMSGNEEACIMLEHAKEIYLDPEYAKIQEAIKAELDRERELAALRAAIERSTEERTSVSMVSVNNSDKFPFSLEDLAYWVVRRKDGTMVKYILVDNAADIGQEKTINRLATSGYKDWQSGFTSYSIGDYCKHDPSTLPVYEADGIQLFIADAPGARAHWKEFDFAIDGGDAISLYESSKKLLSGDAALAATLKKYTTEIQPPELVGVKTRVLKIDWFDRQAPRVVPEFWPALLRLMKAKNGQPPNRVLTICQGGHGRSGTSLVALMMCLTDYTPLDAITHLRAIHCARAIESKVQHQYLNDIAKMLGREENALDAEQVKSFKDRFLSLTCETSRPYRERLMKATAAVQQAAASK